MANGKRNYKKKYVRKNKRRNKKNTRPYKVSIQKLASKKIDSLLERRMVEIANSNRVSLISRKYLFGTFDVENNFIYSFGDISRNNWGGRVVELSNLPKTDVNFPTNIPEISDDVETTNINEALGDQAGAQKGMILHTKNGRRSGDHVKINGITVSLFIQSMATNRTQSLQFENDEYKPTELPNEQLYCYTRIRWAIVSVRSDLIIADPNYEPAANRLIKWNTIGFSNRLDTLAENETSNLKVKTLLTGSVSIRNELNNHNCKQVNRYVKFDNPLLIQYTPVSQTGKEVVKSKLYFVLRTNIPDHTDVAGVSLDRLEYAYPGIFAITKLHYFEE